MRPDSWMAALSSSFHMAEETTTLSGVSFIKVLTPSWWSYPCDLISSQRPHLQNRYIGDDISTYEFGVWYRHSVAAANKGVLLSQLPQQWAGASTHTETPEHGTEHTDHLPSQPTGEGAGYLHPTREGPPKGSSYLSGTSDLSCLWAKWIFATQRQLSQSSRAGRWEPSWGALTWEGDTGTTAASAAPSKPHILFRKVRVIITCIL